MGVTIPEGGGQFWEKHVPDKPNTPTSCKLDWFMQRHAHDGADAWLQTLDESIIGCEGVGLQTAAEVWYLWLPCSQVKTMTDVGGRLETPSSVYTKSAFMDIQASQGQGQHHSGSGSPDGVVAGSGFGSSTLGTVASSYHHQARPSPPQVAGYRHHMHGPSPHHPHQQSQIDIPPGAFMSSNPSVQVTLQGKMLHRPRLTNMLYNVFKYFVNF